MLKVVYLHQLTELFRVRRIILALLFTSVIMVYLPYDFFKSFSSNQAFMASIIDFYFIFYPIVIVVLLSYSANYNLFLEEKTKKTIHSLLSTPLDIKTIWLGKTLAIFTVVYILSIIASFVFLFLVHNYIVFNKTVSPSIYGIISLLVINPIISIFLMGDIGIFTLISKDETKVRIGILIFFFASIFFFRPDMLKADVSLVPYQVAIMLILFIVTRISLKFLSNEKVILSVD
jgi:ABC-2 type transport system permease protein